ncbi:F-box protein CPR1-like [Lycium barbarum]|uniref:F-box protein CPR1-like n=1 Tax=Lycium barbarum TaxID=112863 RepID=UPI00293E10F6|nr:F-box protein CPR1-like [Lycium barbarum]XP_060212810.1 F-box protein CPR1-like [Lycium barbarum]
MKTVYISGTLPNPEITKKFNLSRCRQMMKKKKKKKSLHTCKGKSVVEMDIIASSNGIPIHFQRDIMMEILSRLPVPSLFRFKCVSKSWDNITSDPYFKMKHQSRHALHNSLKFLFVHHDFNKTLSLNFYSSSSLSSFEDVQKVDIPSNIAPFRCIMFASCDGLVLIGFANKFLDQLMLWNPSTRESIQLPLPEFRILDSIFGLAYDEACDDYKILKVHRFKERHPEKPASEILALKSGSWKKVCTRSRIICPWTDSLGRMDPLVFVHGAFHWVVRWPCPFVVSLSISTEVYGKIPLLRIMCECDFISHSSREYVTSHSSREYGVTVLEGMFCFSSTCKFHEEGTFKLWAMKKYGVKESWTELFNINVPGLYVAKPRYRFADGDVLLRCRINGCETLRTSKGPFRLWSKSLSTPGDRVEVISFKESLISLKLLTTI